MQTMMKLGNGTQVQAAVLSGTMVFEKPPVRYGHIGEKPRTCAHPGCKTKLNIYNGTRCEKHGVYRRPHVTK